MTSNFTRQLLGRVCIYFDNSTHNSGFCDRDSMLISKASFNVNTLVVVVVHFTVTLPQE